MSSILRFSEAASLAMHTTVMLAANPGVSMSAGHVASTLGVSEAHLAKVLQQLAKSGLVNSTRGPKGGFRLAKPAAETSLLEVYEAVEGPFKSTDCLLGTPFSHSSNCIFGGLLSRVNEEVRDYMANSHLSELTRFTERDRCKHLQNMPRD